MTVYAQCRRCSTPFALEPVRVVVALPDDAACPAQLLFTCPTCHSSGMWQVPRAVAATLVVQGAASLPAVVLVPPREPHPEAPPSEAPPLSRDDLLELHERLAGLDTVAALLGEVPIAQPGEGRPSDGTTA